MEEKWRESGELFNSALKDLDQAKNDPLRFAAAAKLYEVAFEYTWKFFKRAADEAGLEVYSPRDAIKAAAQLKLISDVELWQRFLNARTLSVHDYIGLSDADFRDLMRKFKKALQELLQAI